MTVMSFPGPLSGQARHGLAVRLAVGASSAVQAQRRVDIAWVRATLPNQSATGSYMCPTSQKNVVLTRASFPVAGIVEVHEMSMDQGIMQMRAAGPGLMEVGQTIEPKSDGVHIMMMKLKKQIKAGESLRMSLSLKAADGIRSVIEANATAGFAPPTR
jgi:hypothetical protein